MKGMAPSPETMNRLRNAEAQVITPEPNKKKGRGSHKGVTFVSDSPPTGVRAEVNQIIYGLHWQYQKRVLDVLKIVTEPSKWDVVREIVMDIENEHIEALRIIVGQRITDHLRQEQDAKENANGQGNGQ